MAQRKATTPTTTSARDEDNQEGYEDAALENALYPLMLAPGEDRNAMYDPDEADTLKVGRGGRGGREGGKARAAGRTASRKLGAGRLSVVAGTGLDSCGSWLWVVCVWE